MSHLSVSFKESQSLNYSRCIIKVITQLGNFAEALCVNKVKEKSKIRESP